MPAPQDLDGCLAQAASNTPEACDKTCRQKGLAYAGDIASVSKRQPDFAKDRANSN
jgi:hypothetical protein